MLNDGLCSLDEIRIKIFGTRGLANNEAQYLQSLTLHEAEAVKALCLFLVRKVSSHGSILPHSLSA
jgi:hypothetical protein